MRRGPDPDLTNEFDYQKLEADNFATNAGGQALVESVEFRLEGIARSALLKYEEWVDVAFHGLLHHEWAGLKPKVLHAIDALHDLRFPEHPGHSRET